MVKHVCNYCGKYIFDQQNINPYKRLTAEEYAHGVVKKLMRTNATPIAICKEMGYHVDWMVNKAECEICGAPHAVFSDNPDAPLVVKTTFFFSGTRKLSEKDMQFIQEFKQDFFRS